MPSKGGKLDCLYELVTPPGAETSLSGTGGRPGFARPRRLGAAARSRKAYQAMRDADRLSMGMRGAPLRGRPVSCIFGPR